MKSYILLSAFITSFFGYAQDYDLPATYNYNPWFTSSEHWNDTLEARRFLGADSIIVDYERLTTQKKLRIEYWPSGDIKSKAVVSQVFFADTVYVLSTDNPTDTLDLEIYSGFKDVLDGEYIEYSHQNLNFGTPHVITHGFFNNGRQVGKWEVWQSQFVTSLLTFNDEGYLDGPYSEYYLYLNGEKGTIRLSGRFQPKKLSENPQTLNRSTGPITISRRIGLWTLYDREGEVIEQVQYERGE